MKKKSIAVLSALMLFSCGTVVEEKNSYPSSTVEVSSLSSVETKESSQEKEHSSAISSFLESSSLPSSTEESSLSTSLSSSSAEEESLFDYQYQAPALLPTISIKTNDNSNDFATLPNRLEKWDYVDAKVSVSNCDEDYELEDVDAGVKVRGW